jgi:hypothetical protein
VCLRIKRIVLLQRTLVETHGLVPLPGAAGIRRLLEQDCRVSWCRRTGNQQQAYP